MGIGTVASPTVKLDINGTLQLKGLQFNNASMNSCSGRLYTGSTGKVLCNNTAIGGGVTGSGTANREAYWTGAGTIAAAGNIYSNGNMLGIGTTFSKASLNVVNTSATGIAIIGNATSGSAGTTYGGYFVSSSLQGIGIYAVSTQPGANTNYGGYFKSSGDNGAGATGQSIGSNGVGVWGYSSGANGVGVSGSGATGVSGASNTSGGKGGSFTSSGSIGYGVAGFATSSGATRNYGLFGNAAGTYGNGVQGYSSGASGRGVVGNVTGVSATAVYGSASASGAVSNFGSQFYAAGDTGYALYAQATSNAAATNYGGYFIAGGTTGRAIYGLASSPTGVNYGVYGSTSSLVGYSGYFTGGNFSVATGNVGIGTATPNYKLLVNVGASNVNNGMVIVGGTGRTLGLYPAETSGATNPLVIAGSSLLGFSAGALNTGKLIIGPWSNTTKGIVINGSNGNIGIGTGTPLVLLDVNGNIQGTGLQFNNVSMNSCTGRLYAGSTGKILCNNSAIGGGGVSGSGVANRAAFWSSSSALSNDGNFTWNNTNKKLGIGTVTPTQQITISSTTTHASLGMYAATGFNSEIDLGIGSTPQAWLGYRNGKKLLVLANYSDDTKGININITKGFVGIGTTNPQQRLVVVADSNNYGQTIVVDNPGGRGLQMQTPDYIYNSVGSTLSFGLMAASGNASSYISAYTYGKKAYGNILLNSAGGNVGIGILNPGTRFVVNDSNGYLKFGRIGGVNPVLNITTPGNVYSDIILGTYTSNAVGGDNVRLRGSTYGLGIGGKYPKMYINYSDANYLMTLAVNGNVGIGTTNPTVFSGGIFPGKLSVLPMGNTDGILVKTDSTATAAASAIFHQSALVPTFDNVRIQSSGSSSSWAILNVLSGVNSTTGIGGTSRLYVRGDGYIGIGTTSPTVQLDVRGRSYVSNVNTGSTSQTSFNVDRQTNITSSTTSYDKAADFYMTTFSTSSGVTDSGYKIAVAAQGYASNSNFLGTLAASYGVWARSGISIAGAGAKINNAYGVYAQVLNTQAGTTIDNGYGVYIDNTGAGGTQTNRYDLYASSPSARNYFAGTVGIGTATPGAKLDILNSGNNIAYLGSLSLGNTGSHYSEIGYNVNFTNTNDVYKYRFADTAASIRLGWGGGIEFKTAASGSGGAALPLANRMRISQLGNVGIGTDSPNQKLEVVGKVNSTGLVLTNTSLTNCNYLKTDSKGIVSCGSMGANPYNVTWKVIYTGTQTVASTGIPSESYHFVVFNTSKTKLVGFRLSGGGPSGQGACMITIRATSSPTSYLATYALTQNARIYLPTVNCPSYVGGLYNFQGNSALGNTGGFTATDFLLSNTATSVVPISYDGTTTNNVNACSSTTAWAFSTPRAWTRMTFNRFTEYTGAPSLLTYVESSGVNVVQWVNGTSGTYSNCVVEAWYQ